jgi:hypothetical protein
LQSLLGISKRSFFFHFKRYNLTIRAVNFFETFCTCSPNSLGQDPTVKFSILFCFLFLLLELEMADLSILFEKNDLRPLGIKVIDDF